MSPLSSSLDPTEVSSNLHVVDLDCYAKIVSDYYPFHALGKFA